MKHNLFCKPPPLDELLTFLSHVCGTNEEEYYRIDTTVFRKIVYYNHHTTFLQDLLPYYRKSRQFYVTRDFTYTSFVNLVRQICTYHQHPCIGNKHYDHQKCTMCYIVKKT